MGKKRLFIVDDHAILRFGLRQLINSESDLTLCGEASDANGALPALAAAKPDLIIIDISLGGRNGLELIKTIRAARYAQPILVLSMHDDAVYAERALRAGAMGYIRKHEATENLIQAIRRILAGEIYLSDRISATLLREMVGKRTGESEARLRNLSDRELEVFEMLGQGRSTRQIAEQLHLSAKTVETHRERIKRKLHFGGATELLQQAAQWVQRQEIAGKSAPTFQSSRLQ